MILFQNVTKIYDDKIIALNDATFQIDKGEFVFVTGPSGAGKSTITKLITREEIPDSGKIAVGGVDVTTLPKNKIPFLRRSMGIVFQDFRLLPKKTVYENVSFAMEVVGANTRAIRRRIPDVLSMVGLTNKAKSYPDQLSGGEQQRVGIARALANKPHILIADEPTGNLDNDTAWEIMSILDHINKQGTTVLMVTHAQNIVDQMQKRVICIENGVVNFPKEEHEYV